MIEKKNDGSCGVCQISYNISEAEYKQPICDTLPQSSVLPGPVIRLRGRQGRVGRKFLLKRTRISGKFQYWRQPFNVEFQCPFFFFKNVFFKISDLMDGHVFDTLPRSLCFCLLKNNICQITEFSERCPVSRFSRFYTTLLRWEWSWTEAEITIPPKVWTHQPG